MNDLAQDLVQRGFNLFAGHETNNLLLDLPVLENKQGRNAANTIALGSDRVAVHVHFADLDLAGVGSGNLVHNGRQGFTRTTPDRPKINQYRLIALKHCLIKISIGDLCNKLRCFAGHKDYFPSPKSQSWWTWNSSNIVPDD